MKFGVGSFRFYCFCDFICFRFNFSIGRMLFIFVLVCLSDNKMDKDLEGWFFFLVVFFYEEVLLFGCVFLVFVYLVFYSLVLMSEVFSNFF